MKCGAYIMKIITGVFLIIIGCMSGVYNVSAAEENIIKIIFQADDTGIPGAAFSLFKVGTLDEGEYEWTGEVEVLQDFPYVPSELSVKSEEMAKALEKNTGLISAAAEDITDEKGAISFKNLEDGIYLVCQTGCQENAKKYTMAAPFLITVPYWNEDNIYSNEAVAFPKTELKALSGNADSGNEQMKRASDGKTSTGKVQNHVLIKNPVKTGDESKGAYFLCVAFLSLCTIICILEGFKRRKNRICSCEKL